MTGVTVQSMQLLFPAPGGLRSCHKVTAQTSAGIAKALPLRHGFSTQETGEMVESWQFMTRAWEEGACMLHMLRVLCWFNLTYILMLFLNILSVFTRRIEIIR